MKSYKNLYLKIYDLKNLILAYKKARKGKTKKHYVIEFEKDLAYNLKILHDELKNQTYKPKPLKKFILRDPKTRKISKSDFRDRIVHHALIRIIEPLFDKIFIYDSCANRIGKGNLFATNRFYCFMRKVSRNGKLNGWFNNNQIKGYCFKADIKHYFQEIDQEILLKIIKRKIKCKKTLYLITRIIKNFDNKTKGMPLGNLTSQFFANVYLNELDQFVKHNLNIKFYIRYVDDFVILHPSKLQLIEWKQKVNRFLNEALRVELHSEKSKIVSLSRGIDLVGFRNFYHFKILRKRNIKNMFSKVTEYKESIVSKESLLDSFQGWSAYAKWANTFRLRKEISKKIIKKTVPKTLSLKNVISLE
jgi:RNA-directed DNA polymerase